MTAAALAPSVHPAAYAAAVLAHLDEQLASARRLLEAVLAEGAAIRRQDVEGVLAQLTVMQGEMELRSRMDRDRSALLLQGAQALGVPAHAVTLEALTSLMPPAEAAAARERSANLRGLLAEIGREHQINRALMRQELAFLDHLTRLLGGAEDTGYRPPGEAGARLGGRDSQSSPMVHRVLDLRA